MGEMEKEAAGMETPGSRVVVRKSRKQKVWAQLGPGVKTWNGLEWLETGGWGGEEVEGRQEETGEEASRFTCDLIFSGKSEVLSSAESHIQVLGIEQIIKIRA